MYRATFALTATLASLAAAVPSQAADDPGYLATIERTAGMVADPGIRALVQRHGLDLVDVTWEDTGRYENSAVGGNISDLSIQVQHCAQPDICSLHLMPVIRFPNFEDRTGDVPLDDLEVLVGNQSGEELQSVTLRELLGDLRSYLHDGSSWAGKRTSLLAPRDSHALVSAQAAFLPIGPGGTAEFNPVLFNYQSAPGAPAVLTLVATPEGTSATVIDNARDAFEAGQTWGQRLFFNQDGERASLTGKRASEAGGSVVFVDRGGAEPPKPADAAGLNTVMVIQVPLVHPEWEPPPVAEGGAVAMDMLASAPMAKTEDAVIGHGEVEGPFTELDHLAIERDTRYPIRVTVQFYKATESGQVSEADLDAIRKGIDRVYEDADYTGSLVVDGRVGRPTEHDGPRVEPPGWWRAFFAHAESKLGWTPGEILAWWDRPVGGEPPPIG